MRDERVPRSAKLKTVGAGLHAWVDGDIVPDPIRLVTGLGYADDIIIRAPVSGKKPSDVTQVIVRTHPA